MEYKAAKPISALVLSGRKMGNYHMVGRKKKGKGGIKVRKRGGGGIKKMIRIGGQYLGAEENRGRFIWLGKMDLSRKFKGKGNGEKRGCRQTGSKKKKGKKQGPKWKKGKERGMFCLKLRKFSTEEGGTQLEARRKENQMNHRTSALSNGKMEKKRGRFVGRKKPEEGAGHHERGGKLATIRKAVQMIKTAQSITRGESFIG